MVRRLAAGLILVLVTILGASAPLLAQDPLSPPGDINPRPLETEDLRAAQAIPDGLADDTLRYLFLEIALLEELDAFTANGLLEPGIVHAKYGRWPDADREKLLATLNTVDAELASRSAAFRLVPGATNSQLDFAVGPIPADWYTELASGRSRFVLGFEYLGALDSLLASRVDIDPTGFGDEVLQLSVQLDLASTRLAEAEALNRILSAEIGDLQREVAALAGSPGPGAIRPSTTSWTTWIVAGGGALLVLLLMAIFITTRRESRRRATDHVTTDAMEAHRLLSATRTEADVAEVAADVGARLTGAHGAAVLRRTPDGLRAAGQPDVLIGSGLSRIVEAGQPLATAISNDPLLPGIEARVVGVPVVNNGSIIAVLAAWNVGTKALPKSTRSSLELISPAIGGALIRVDEMVSMEKMAMIDGLTSLGNRRRLDGDLESTLADAVMSDLPVGFAMIDVDHFKTYNDTHGHTAGDVALQNVAATIAACVRDSDVVYRYGGEEFSMLLPGASPEEAVAAAERVRAAVEALEVAGEHLQPSGKLTVSIGVATLESGQAGNIKERADAALYRAKSGGRNTVVID